MYLVTTTAVRMESSGGSAVFFCNPPMPALDALRVAMAGLDRALNVEVFDIETGDIVSFSKLRKAANAQET